MFYRRYLVICSLLVATVIILLLIRSKTRQQDPQYLAQHYRGPRLRYTFQWAKVKEQNDTTTTTTNSTEVQDTGPAAALPSDMTTKAVVRVADILRNQSNLIEEEMVGYKFPDPNRPHLSDYIPARGGRPMSYLLLSTWEARGPLVGKIINTVPGTFFIEEPLMRFGMSQVNATLVPNAMKQLKNIMRCNFNEAPDYLEDFRKYPNLVRTNERLWNACRIRGGKYCFSEEFVHAICKRFPVKAMSLVRLRLSDTTQWLEDEEADVRIVLLVRDPRALFQSRKNKNYCKNQLDCSETSRMCQFMMEDYSAYQELSAAYPGRLTVLRFEDLALDPFGETRKLLDFLRAPYTERTNELLLHHSIPSNTTNAQILKEPPFEWMNRLSFDKVDAIQQQCRSITTAWGYTLMTNTSLTDPKFIPLTALPDNHNRAGGH